MRRTPKRPFIAWGDGSDYPQPIGVADGYAHYAYRDRGDSAMATVTGYGCTPWYAEIQELYEDAERPT